MPNRNRMRAAVVITVWFALSTYALSADIPTVNWTQLSTSTLPTGRSNAAAAYDPISKKLVVFGGLSSQGYLSETWTFDGTNWSQVNTSSAPPVRSNASMAFDKVCGKIVLFGGYNGQNYLGDTWTWDGSTSTWTNANPVHAPTAVTGPMLFTDPANGHADAYGGFDGMFFTGTTYQWTGTDWKLLNPNPFPSPRASGLVSYDGANKTVVIFDGLGDINPDNTWTWNGKNWTMQSPATQPPSGFGSSGAYDPAFKAAISFGGGEGTDTWAWTTANNWVKLAPSQSPGARQSPSVVWDPVIGHIVLVGGQSGTTFLSDTWILDPH